MDSSRRRRSPPKRRRHSLKQPPRRVRQMSPVGSRATWLNPGIEGADDSVLGAERTEALIRRVNTLEEVATVRELLPFLTGERG